MEVQYPANLAPLGIARAAQPDAQIGRIRSSSQEMNAAVTAVLNGESIKANSRPMEDFLRLAMPVVAGAQAKLAIGAIDEQSHFQWLLAPEDARPAPAETDARPATLAEPERPSLRGAGPPTTR